MTRFLISVIIRIIKNKRSLKLRKIKYTILELIKKVKNNCKIIRKLISEDELKLLLEHIYFLFKKNIEILNENINYKENQIILPTTSLERGDVVWVDFGYGIGAEFRYFHYAVVLAVEDNQVIVIPLTSSDTRVGKTQMMIDIGYIEKIASESETKEKNNKKSYALIKSIRSISITRIIIPKRNDRKLRLKLNKEQLDLLDEAIKKYLTKS